MLHMFLREGDWFAAKRFGYGAGLPIAWQGWVLLLAYIGGMIGLGIVSENASAGVRMVAIAGLAVLTVLFLMIVNKRTRGGWRWRP